MTYVHGISASLAAALMSLLVLTGCGGAESRRASHMERGQQFFAEGNFEKARVEFRNALQVAPNDPQVRFMNARVAERLGDVAAAAGTYQSVIDANPDHIEARSNLARIFVFAGAPERAMELVEPGLARHPDSAALLTVRGAARLQLKNRAGARADAERAVQLAPDNENAVALLASIHRQEGQPQQAIDLVQRTLEKTPSSVDLRQVLASLYAVTGEQERAEEQMRKVVDLRPQELPLRYQLALTYIRGKKIDDAERVLNDAMVVAPKASEPKLAYVEFLTAQRSPARGEQAMKDFIAREPDNYELLLGVAGIQQRLGRTPEAVSIYDKIVAAAGDDPKGLEARNRIAAVRVTERRFDDALKLVAQVLEKNSRDNDALILRGNIALERGDPTSAISDLRAVLRDQPGATGVLRTLARAHTLNGEPALAEENLRTAMQASPADAAVRIDLGQLLAQSGRAEQAVAILEETVKAAPTNPAAREALVRAYISNKDLAAARTGAEDLKVAAPNLATGPYLAGMVADAQKRPDDAVKEFERALQLQPSAMDALAALARVEAQRGRQAAAVTRVKAAADAAPDNAIARNLLGELYLAGQQYPEAVAVLNDAVRIAPKWWVPYRNIAYTKLAQRDVPGAISIYETGVKATDYQAALVSELATIYERNDRSEDAIRQYEELHKRNPRLELAANNLAMLLVTYRKDKASLDRARDLTAPLAGSSVGAFLDTHGWVRFKRGEFTEALPVLERAVQRDPESKILRFHLGMTQYKVGQRDQAATNLQKSLDGEASFAGADEARSTLAQLKGSSTG